MTPSNLGILFAPCFLRKNNEDIGELLLNVRRRPMVIEFVIENYDKLFPDCVYDGEDDEKYQ